MAAPSMSCPSGGQFYACAHGSRFLGCCTTNPCGVSGCPADNLIATSFDPAQYDFFVDQQCSGGRFFTCTGNEPPFWGCCKSDPCRAGRCSADNLAGAFLSSNPVDAAPYLVLNGTTGMSSSSFEPTASRSSTPTTGASATSTASRSSTNTGAIVGGAVGGFAVLAALGFGLFWLLRHRRDLHIERQAMIEMQKPNDNHDFMKDSAGLYTGSPTAPPYPDSPQTPFSPLPFSPDSPRHVQEHLTQELPGSPVGCSSEPLCSQTAFLELDGGQRYHPYRQG